MESLWVVRSSGAPLGRSSPSQISPDGARPSDIGFEPLNRLRSLLKDLRGMLYFFSLSSGSNSSFLIF